MELSKQDERIIERMLEVCRTQDQCKDWLGGQIQASYSKAESMRIMQNARAVQAYYADIRQLSRLRFYLDELTGHLPA